MDLPDPLDLMEKEEHPDLREDLARVVPKE